MIQWQINHLYLLASEHERLNCIEFSPHTHSIIALPSHRAHLDPAPRGNMSSTLHACSVHMVRAGRTVGRRRTEEGGRCTGRKARCLPDITAVVGTMADVVIERRTVVLGLPPSPSLLPAGGGNGTPGEIAATRPM